MADQQALVDWICRTPLSSFRTGLNNHNSAGRHLDFLEGVLLWRVCVLVLLSRAA